MSVGHIDYILTEKNCLLMNLMLYTISIEIKLMLMVKD